MKSKILLFLIILSVFLVESIFGQNTFQIILGGINQDYCSSIQNTNDGGFIIAGTTNSFGSDSGDVYIIKINTVGDTMWTKTFGGINQDYCSSIQNTSDGGFIILGSTNSFGAGNYDVYLLKIDSIGNLQWSKTYGGIDYDSGRTIQETTDGGFIIGGETKSFGVGYFNIYLIKINIIGDTSWTKTYGKTDTNLRFRHIEQTTDGGFVIVGGFLDNNSYDFWDIYVLKTDSIGNLQWNNLIYNCGISRSGPASQDFASSIIQTTDGGFVITGNTENCNIGDEYVYLIKLNYNGGHIWSKLYGGPSYYNTGYSVKQTLDNGFVVVGITNSFGFGMQDVYILKTDSNGNLIWSKTYGGASNDLASSIQITNDGGFIFGGITNSLGAGGYDVYIIKTDSLGNSGCNETIPLTRTPSSYTGQSSINITILSTRTIINNPNTLVNCGGTLNKLCSIGIYETTSENIFSLFPNPANNYFDLFSNHLIIKGEIQLFNILGKMVLKENLDNESEIRINIKNISDGIYFVKVIDRENHFCKQLIIERN